MPLVMVVLLAVEMRQPPVERGSSIQITLRRVGLVGVVALLLTAGASVTVAQSQLARNVLRRLQPTEPCSLFQPGRVLFEADWSTGLDDWGAGPEWSVVDGVLSFDGSSPGSIAYAPPPATSDYAVETEVQVAPGARDGFAIFLRQLIAIEYRATIDEGKATIETGGRFRRSLASVDLDPGTDWHRYRFEARDRQFRLMIDGVCVLEAEGATVSTNTGAYHTGIRTGQGIVRVRSFKIIGE
jgi:hypothetical protein